MTDPLPAGATAHPPDPTLVSYTHWMYALHAVAAFIGIVSSAAIALQFVFGVPSIIAIIMNYARRSEARGTWLESHFAWQRRTFWWALLWVAIIFVLSLPLFLIIVGFVTFGLGVLVVGLWVVYRVVRGWLKLRDGQPVGA